MMIDPPDPSNKWELKDYTAAESRQAREEYEAFKHQREAIYTDKMNQYVYARSSIGHPRVTPDKVMQITKKNDERGVSDFAFILENGQCSKAALRAYFED